MEHAGDALIALGWVCLVVGLSLYAWHTVQRWLWETEWQRKMENTSA